MNDFENLDNLKMKYINLSRYLKTPLQVWKIKFFLWVTLLFSAFGTSFLIHWALTAPVSFTNIEITDSPWGGYVFGFIIIWPVYAVAFLVALAFSVALYTSTYDTTSEKVHDRGEKKTRKWFQSAVFFETSLDVLFIRLTGVVGMVMISYGAVQNFTDHLKFESERIAAQKSDLSNYQNTAGIIENIKYWSDKQINGKNDDDALADSMLTYYRDRLQTFNRRADSLNTEIYNKAELRTSKIIDITASVKFISKGDKFLSGLILIVFLSIIALANDGSAVRLTRIQSRYDQAKQIRDMYMQENSFMENLLDGNPAGNRAESGNASKSKVDFRGGKDILESDSAKLIIYAKVKDPAQSNRQIGKALGYSHTWVNDVLTAWREQQQKYEAA